MGKSNLPLIILLGLLILVAGIAFKFYGDVQSLSSINSRLSGEKNTLTQEKEAISKKLDDKVKDAVALEKELKEVELKVSRLEKEKDNLDYLTKKIKEEKKDLLSQVGSLKKALSERPKTVSAPAAVASYPSRTEKSGDVPPYWEDVVLKKAEYQARVEEFRKELSEAKVKISNLDKVNKELSIKIDELTRAKKQVEDNLAFKERTLQLLSKDLVNQKETTQNLSVEAEKLRSENISLKRELVAANEEQASLQESLQRSEAMKEELEIRVERIEKVVQEKSLMFQQLKGELSNALSRSVDEQVSSSIDLPPIVVGRGAPVSSAVIPAAPAATALRGTVIAVNPRENFVIVDIGQDSGLLPGTTMDVFRDGRSIGIIEVIEVRKEIAAADIKSVASGEMIRETDTAVSK